MSLQRISYPDRVSWLTGRAERGIGASEAAAVCGMSPWLSKNELWEIKRGIRKAKDISDNAEVQRGVSMEGAVRNFFAALHPELFVVHNPYDILYQAERPWIFATLDGEITESGFRDPPEGTKHIYIPAGGEPVEKPVHRVPFIRHGILEVKTASPNGKEGWAAWERRVPDHYYCQVLHQLAATGYDFAILQAALWTRSGDIILREYSFERADCEADITWLLEQEEKFWESVQTGKRPGAPIRF